MTNDELHSELCGYVEHLHSISHVDIHYNRMTFYDGTRLVFVTHLTRHVFVTHLTEHIPRFLKIGNRWCLVFYKDQSAPPRRPLRVSTIVETPHSEEPPAQMELEEPGQGTSANKMSDVNSVKSETFQRPVVDKSMPEASLISKRVRKPEEEGKENVGNKKKERGR